MTFKSPRRFARTCAPLLVVIPLASCGTTTGSSASDALRQLFAIKPDLPKELTQASFCDVAAPLSWSEADTAETVIGVKEQNAVGKKLCGWGTSGSQKPAT